MVTGDTIDIGTHDAQIAELTIVESGQFTHGLLIGGPFLESLADVHLKSLSFTRMYIGRGSDGEQMEIDQRSYAFSASR